MVPDGSVVARFSNVRKTYHLTGQTIHALDGISFEIKDGEMVAIVGPSGSGKSTLMHILGCLDSATSGTVEIAGKDLSRASPTTLAGVRNQNIGFVFQMFNLLPRFNVLENVELPLLYSGIRSAERRVRAVEAVRAVGLEQRMKSRPSQLSGGQAQRVAIARALVNGPRMILADEPTGSLDSKTGDEIFELFCQLNKQGKTVVIVTHDLNLAKRIPRRLEMRDGQIVRDICGW
jgi:putative ABC transport system ATP-binding protein